VRCVQVPATLLRCSNLCCQGMWLWQLCHDSLRCTLRSLHQNEFLVHHIAKELLVCCTAVKSFCHGNHPKRDCNCIDMSLPNQPSHALHSASLHQCLHPANPALNQACLQSCLQQGNQTGSFFLRSKLCHCCTPHSTHEGFQVQEIQLIKVATTAKQTLPPLSLFPQLPVNCMVPTFFAFFHTFLCHFHLPACLFVFST